MLEVRDGRSIRHLQDWMSTLQLVKSNSTRHEILNIRLKATKIETAGGGIVFKKLIPSYLHIENFLHTYMIN